MVRNVNDEVVYKKFFIRRKCKIIKVITHMLIRWEQGYGPQPYSEYSYVVKFKNGKTKEVDEKNLV